MARIKTIFIDQKSVKQFQRKMKAHRDELAVHLDHFKDMITDLESDCRRIGNAITALDRAMGACCSAADYARKA